MTDKPEIVIPYMEYGYTVLNEDGSETWHPNPHLKMTRGEQLAHNARVRAARLARYRRDFGNPTPSDTE